MWVGGLTGELAFAACYGGARYVVQAGVDYLCLDLRADLFSCVNPALRQWWRLEC
jgi:hypothetical protein